MKIQVLTSSVLGQFVFEFKEKEVKVYDLNTESCHVLPEERGRIFYSKVKKTALNLGLVISEEREEVEV